MYFSFCFCLLLSKLAFFFWRKKKKKSVTARFVCVQFRKLELGLEGGRRAVPLTLEKKKLLIIVSKSKVLQEFYKDKIIIIIFGLSPK